MVVEYLLTEATPASPVTSYLTNDTLGSPRVITDSSGNVTSRRDFMPFGEEISAIGGRTSGLGYQTDATRQKFTGYERDNETDLDFAQARYFDSGFGRFSSPDDFLNDTRVSDPQSWNLYTYVRNNPLNSVDSLGKKSTVCYYYDKETNTTYVTVSASFAVYGAEGQNVTAEDLEKYKNVLINGIQEMFKKEFETNGRKFSLSADITAKVVGSEKEAAESGVDNIVELGYNELENPDGSDANAKGVGFGVMGENFDRMAVEIPKGKVTGFSNIGGTFAHEFGAHLFDTMHSDDPNSFLRSSEGGTFPLHDFKRIFDPEDQIPSPTGGKLPPQGSKVLTSTGMGSEDRQANRHTSPREVYRWSKEVKKW